MKQYVLVIGYQKKQNKKQIIPHVGKVQKSNRKIVSAEAKSIPLTDIYMTAHIPGLGQSLE